MTNVIWKMENFRNRNPESYGENDAETTSAHSRGASPGFVARGDGHRPDVVRSDHGLQRLGRDQKSERVFVRTDSVGGAGIDRDAHNAARRLSPPWAAGVRLRFSGRMRAPLIAGFPVPEG